MAKLALVIFALVLFIGCSVGAPAKSDQSDTPPNDKPAKGKGEEKSSDEAKQPVAVEEDGRSSQPPGPLASLGFGLPQAFLGGAERQWTNPFAVLHNVGNSAAGLLGGLTSSLTNAGTGGNEETGGTGSTAVAGGSGMVDPESGQAVGTGTGIVDAGPNGFGVALGVGGAIDTPFGTHTFGQGNSVVIDGPQLPFGNFAANG